MWLTNNQLRQSRMSVQSNAETIWQSFNNFIQDHVGVETIQGGADGQANRHDSII
jgi:hypothetical protein